MSHSPEEGEKTFTILFEGHDPVSGGQGPDAGGLCRSSIEHSLLSAGLEGCAGTQQEVLKYHADAGI